MSCFPDSTYTPRRTLLPVPEDTRVHLSAAPSSLGPPGLRTPSAPPGLRPSPAPTPAPATTPAPSGAGDGIKVCVSGRLRLSRSFPLLPISIALLISQEERDKLQQELTLSRNETERAVNVMRDTQFKYDRLEVWLLAACGFLVGIWGGSGIRTDFRAPLALQGYTSTQGASGSSLPNLNDDFFGCALRRGNTGSWRRATQSSR